MGRLLMISGLVFSSALPAWKTYIQIIRQIGKCCKIKQECIIDTGNNTQTQKNSRCDLRSGELCCCSGGAYSCATSWLVVGGGE